MTRPRWFIGFLAILLLGTAPVAAWGQVQVPSPGDAVYEVTLADGSSFFARVSEVTEDQVVFITVGGSRLEVEPAQIRDIVRAQGEVVEGQLWHRDRSESRLFFTATGRTLRSGEAYLGTYLIVLPFAAFGVTDRLTLAAGAPVLFGEFEPFYIAPKLQIIRTDGVQVAAGTLLFFFDDENVGIAYGVGTVGGDQRALSLGVGFGYSGSDFESQPVAMVGGETRVSRRIKLLTENYFLPGETGIVLSGGLRFIGDRFSTDIGIAGAADGDDTGCCVPLINFSYGFGNR